MLAFEAESCEVDDAHRHSTNIFRDCAQGSRAFLESRVLPESVYTSAAWRARGSFWVVVVAGEALVLGVVVGLVRGRVEGRARACLMARVRLEPWRDIGVRDEGDCGRDGVLDLRLWRERVASAVPGVAPAEATAVGRRRARARRWPAQ